jgi:thiamine biosynthesis lipoprotein
MSPDPLDAEVLSTVWLVAGAQQRQEVRKNFPDMIASVYEL